MENRYEAQKSGSNGTWALYDHIRKCTILKSVTPKATYNEEIMTKAAKALNAMFQTNLTNLPKDFQKNQQ